MNKDDDGDGDDDDDSSKHRCLLVPPLPPPLPPWMGCQSIIGYTLVGWISTALLLPPADSRWIEPVLYRHVV